MTRLILSSRWIMGSFTLFDNKQQTVLKRQLKHAVRLWNPPVIRTHDVEDDT